jgi:hypothetical protein
MRRPSGKGRNALDPAPLSISVEELFADAGWSSSIRLNDN